MSFLRFTFRHFGNNKVQFSIAIAGLMLGWLCFISIGIYLKGELSYDRFHEKNNRIFRLTHNEKAGEIPGNRHLATVGPPMGPGLKDAYPQVEDYVRFRHSPDWIVRYNDRLHYENSVWYVDPSIFNVFNFTLKEGSPATALTFPNNVVITQEMAFKYFGNEDPIGKTLTMNQTEWKVTGVLNSIPSNSHITFDFLLPFQSFRVPFGFPVSLESWGWISFHTYILLKPGQDAKALEKQLSGLVKQHWEGERAKKFKLELQPLQEIYLGEVKHDQLASGNSMYLSVLGVAGILIMLVASFNFANLFTAVSLSRAKGVSVRKLLGAAQKQIAFNLHFEAILLVVASLVVSILVLTIGVDFIPWSTALNQFSIMEILEGILTLFLLSVSIGLLAGFYPSRLLIHYDFQKLLKGLFKVGTTGLVLRRGMLLIQFIVSIALLCSVLIISSQMEYLQKKDLGYVKDELLLLHVPGEELVSKFHLLKNQLTQNPNVIDVSVGGGRMVTMGTFLFIQKQTRKQGGQCQLMRLHLITLKQLELSL